MDLPPAHRSLVLRQDGFRELPALLNLVEEGTSNLPRRLPTAMSRTFTLHNTLTGRTEPLALQEEGHLRFYGCGPTVYSYAHIGNFRSFLTSDLILRTAQAIGWRTTYVTNITDVGHLTADDYIDPSGEDRMARALRSKDGERFANVWDLARYYAETLIEDWRTLNLREPDVRPRATEHVREQIRAIENLVACGAAYETSQGVYFSVPAFRDYGRLSGNEAAASLETAVRAVVVDPEKRDARDFALWKKDADHLMQWHSPWGWGFPGWHIECSVMAQAYLGETIDLHSGGEDLIFPHHECEIAQAESLTGRPFATHWVHSRFLQVEGRKMSKRLGNFHTVRDLVSPPGGAASGVDPLALRLALISGQYRKPFNFTFATLRDCARHAQRFSEGWRVVNAAAAEGPDRLGQGLEEAYEQALSAMLDDLNTPAAIAAALEGLKQILARGPSLSEASARGGRTFLERINGLLGIVYHEEAAPAEELPDPLEEQIERLLAERAAARKKKDFDRADAIRDHIDALGIEVMDAPGGTTWRRKVHIP